MSKVDEVVRRSMRPEEKPQHDLQSLRRRLFLGMLSWMAFTLLGGFLFEHTPAMKFISVFVIAGWAMLAVFTVRYMIYFIFGKRE